MFLPIECSLNELENVCLILFVQILGRVCKKYDVSKVDWTNGLVWSMFMFLCVFHRLCMSLFFERLPLAMIFRCERPELHRDLKKTS